MSLNKHIYGTLSELHLKWFAINGVCDCLNLSLACAYVDFYMLQTINAAQKYFWYNNGKIHRKKIVYFFLIHLQRIMVFGHRVFKTNFGGCWVMQNGQRHFLNTSDNLFIFYAQVSDGCTSATWRGVEWQLSRRTPQKCLAVISVYFFMCAHR